MTTQANQPGGSGLIWLAMAVATIAPLGLLPFAQAFAQSALDFDGRPPHDDLTNISTWGLIFGVIGWFGIFAAVAPESLGFRLGRLLLACFVVGAVLEIGRRFGSDYYQYNFHPFWSRPGPVPPLGQVNLSEILPNAVAFSVVAVAAAIEAALLIRIYRWRRCTVGPDGDVDPFGGTKPKYRVTISQLMLWTAVVAALVAAGRRFIEVEDSWSFESESLLAVAGMGFVVGLIPAAATIPFAFLMLDGQPTRQSRRFIRKTFLPAAVVVFLMALVQVVNGFLGSGFADTVRRLLIGLTGISLCVGPAITHLAVARSLGWRLVRPPKTPSCRIAAGQGHGRDTSSARAFQGLHAGKPPATNH